MELSNRNPNVITAYGCYVLLLQISKHEKAARDFASLVFSMRREITQEVHFIAFTEEFVVRVLKGFKVYV